MSEQRSVSERRQRCKCGHSKHCHGNGRTSCAWCPCEGFERRQGIIYPAGIAAVWRDLSVAVEMWERNPKGCTDGDLVMKWNQFRDALFNFKARIAEGRNDE